MIFSVRWGPGSIWYSDLWIKNKSHFSNIPSLVRQKINLPPTPEFMEASVIESVLQTDVTNVIYPGLAVFCLFWESSVVILLWDLDCSCEVLLHFLLLPMNKEVMFCLGVLQPWKTAWCTNNTCFYCRLLMSSLLSCLSSFMISLAP